MKINFVENIMFTIANSNIQNETIINPSTLKKVEVKIIHILDSILSHISSSYRQIRARLSNQVKVIDSDKHEKSASVAKVLEVFQNSWGPLTNPLGQELREIKKATEQDDLSIIAYREEEKVDEILPEQIVKLEQLELEKEKTVDDLKKAFGKLDVEGLLERDLEKEQFEDMVDLQRAFGKLDVEGLSESNPEIEKEVERRDLEILTQYLSENPGALAAFSMLYQEMAAADIVETFNTAFEGIDPEGLVEVDEGIEKIAARYNDEKVKANLLNWFKSEDFKRNLIENPGAMAGFISFLQAAAAEGELMDVLQILKAALWDKSKGLYMPDTEEKKG